ncbi:VanZ family protein [Metabacillus endolithicus]
MHQSFVPARSATVIDFVKDTIGVLVSYYIAKRKFFKK